MTIDKERIKQLNIETYNRWAPDYDKAFATKHPRKLNHVIIDMLSAYPTSSLLDVGCGTGYFLELVCERYPGIRLAGLDITQGMLDMARVRLGDSADLRLGEIESLPWPDDSFNVVTSTDVCHHLAEPTVALQEIKRVLKADGVLMIADLWFPPPFRQLFNLILPFTNEGDVKVYSRQEMLSFMAAAGFKDIAWRRFHVLGQITTGSKQRRGV